MAAALGRSARDLNDELARDASAYEFFQAVRLLSLTARRAGDKSSDGLPPGLRFRTTASLSFPPSELVGYSPAASGPLIDEARDEMTVAFMGLTGPSGALPAIYTELLIERRDVFGDTAAHAFLDLFSHRAVALFHGAWRKYRHWLGVESGERDGLTRNVLDLAGVGFGPLREALDAGGMTGFGESFFIRHAGLLAQKPLSASAVTSLVGAFAGVPAELVQFVGHWVELPLGEQTRLELGRNELGSAFIGGRQWNRQTKVELRLGPMRRERFEQFLPGERGAEGLEALMRFAVGFGLACDVTLVLDRRDVPEPRLAAGASLRLGGNVWLADGPPVVDPDQMCYRLLQ
ncbi:type VI secretion system baseplate subunit TssG [Aromatoleum sp.]|uniref:type VI secretion system baseplate subunit TssG n=1 Tax=Aromatoleum sp. TaxID=2307007 RepID=UPI002FC6A7C6